jgi:hypothetical protein
MTAGHLILVAGASPGISAAVLQCCSAAVLQWRALSARKGPPSWG